MALKSKRFAGNQKLEAAAVTDKGHILRGATGIHVAKIQSALIELDGAFISEKEIHASFYGPSTASAVLFFKKKRSIINRSYQTQADDIVGKMTIATLDSEILAKETASDEPAKLIPISPQKRLTRSITNPITARPNLILSFAIEGSLIQTPRPVFDNVAVEIKEGGIGSFRVINGVGGILSIDPKIAVIFDPNQASATNFIPVTKNPQVFNVRGVNPGLTIISLQKPFVSLLSMPQPIVVIVRSKTDPFREFSSGTQHNHPASGKWAEVSSSPRNSGVGDNEGGNTDGGIFTGNVLFPICKGCSTPKCVIDKVISLGFGNKPIAKAHINHYLSGGGRDLDEDDNIREWIRRDGGIRLAIKREIVAFPIKSGKKGGNFEFLQPQYDDEDFKNAFGGIDRVDFEVNFDFDECTVWFQDRYEWHPVYEGLYNRLEDEQARSTNCVHAAFVEMKSQGARDFWMIGEATVPLKDILR